MKWPWSPDRENGVWRATFSIPIGAEQGLRVGMSMYTESTWRQRGLVTVIEPDRAELEVVFHYISSFPETMANSGQVFSTVP